MSTRQRTRTTLAGVIGNILELYDFGIFLFLAPVLANLFFPAGDPTVSLLQTFSVFAVGYFMRPIGGMVLGHLGDRWGRKRALQWSILLMAGSTTLMGLLPTYAQVGMAAPLMLTAMRLLQGVSVGGEMIGTFSFFGEKAGDHGRGFLSSWSTFSAVAGLLIGSGVAALLGQVLSFEQLQDGAWRVPFLFGALVGLIGLWLRAGIDETTVFEDARVKGELARRPLVTAFREDGKSILAAFVLTVPLSVGFYLPFAWLPTWLTRLHQPAVPNALLANTIAMSMLALLIPVAGAASDRWGHKRIYCIGAAGVVLLAYPVYLLFAQAVWGAALAGQLILALFLAMPLGAGPAMLIALFPTRTRYSGSAVGFNIAQALLGGTAPFVATWLLATTGEGVVPFLYLSALMTLAFFTALAVNDLHGKPLR